MNALLLLAIAAAVLGSLVWLASWSARQQRELKRSWARLLAEKVGGTTIPTSDDENNPWIRFKVGGREAEFYFQGGEDGRTTVDISVTGISPGALSVTPGAWPRFLRRLFRLQKLELDAPWFDQNYTVRATPEDLAIRLFDGERRGRLLGRIRQLEKFGLPIVELTRDKLSVGVARRIDDVAVLTVLIRCAEPFLDALSVMSVGTAGPWTRGGRCPVCASELAEDVLTCPACRTPHHADCWRYVGRCSVYACRGRV